MAYFLLTHGGMTYSVQTRVWLKQQSVSYSLLTHECMAYSLLTHEDVAYSILTHGTWSIIF